MNPNPELDSKLEVYIQALRQTDPRDPQIAAKARESFLAEAAQIAPRISTSSQSQKDKRIAALKSLRMPMQMALRPMFNLFILTLLIFGAIMGFGATTIAAAQSAQPDETLYPIKTWSEDMRLSLENDPQGKLDLALQFSARRSDEIEYLFQADAVIPAKVITRFEHQQTQVLELAVGLSDNQTIPALERVRDQARQQKLLLGQTQVKNTAARQIHNQIQAMLQKQENLAEQGIQDPEWLRKQFRMRPGRNGTWQVAPTVTATESTPTLPAGANSLTTGTPAPGAGYGPNGPQNRWITGTPMPGAGYGPGPGTSDCTTCTPQPKSGSPTDKPRNDSGNDGKGGNGNNDQPAPNQPPGGGGGGNKP